MVSETNITNKLKKTVSEIFNGLQKLFESDPDVKTVIQMSSYNTRTDLIRISDIDIGIILESNEYMYTKNINGYMCYNKMVKIKDLCHGDGNRNKSERI